MRTAAKQAFSLPFVPGSPTHHLPLGIGQHVFRPASIEYPGIYRRRGRPWLSNGPDEPHVNRIHLQVTRIPDRPSKIASREALAKRRAQPVTCIGQHTTEAHASRGNAVDLSERDLRLGTCRLRFKRNACALNRGRSPSNSSGRKGATPPSLGLRRVRASAIPASGSWRLAKHRSILRSNTDRMLAANRAIERGRNLRRGSSACRNRNSAGQQQRKSGGDRHRAQLTLNGKSAEPTQVPFTARRWRRIPGRRERDQDGEPGVDQQRLLEGDHDQRAGNAGERDHRTLRRISKPPTMRTGM